MVYLDDKRLDIPLVVIPLVGELVDKMMVDPANDLFGGYYPFLRRIVLPFILIMVFILIFDLSKGSMIISAIFTGFSIGPILILERMLVIHLITQHDKENT